MSLQRNLNQGIRDINKFRELVLQYGPAFLSTLGEAGEGVVRGLARQAGMAQPATRRALPAATRPAAQTAATAVRPVQEATQLRLPLSSVTREKGRFVSPYGPRISPADVDARMALRTPPSLEEVEALRSALRRPEAPGQMSIFSAPEPAFRTTPMQGPVSEAAIRLYDQDPGTYKSINDLAQRASSYFGKPVTVDDLVSPAGLKIIDELELATRGGSLARGGARGLTAPGGPGGIVPGSRGGTLGSSRGGALVESPGGSLSARMGNIDSETAARAYLGDDVIDVPFEELRNAAGGLRTIDLRKVAALGGLAGLGAAGYMSRMGQSEYQPGQPTQSVDTPYPSDIAPSPLPLPTQDPGSFGIPGSTGGQPLMAGQAGAGQTPVAGQAGAGQVIIRRSGARDEALNEAIQNAQAASGLTKNQEDLLRYYQQRQAYAQSPSGGAQITQEFAALGGEFATPEMSKWAAANLPLAFELVQKMKGQRKLPSQQMPQSQQIGRPMTEMGSDTMRNAAGNVQMAGQTATMPTQGAADIQQATTPYYPVEMVGPNNPGYNMYGYPLIRGGI
jgi:hypothetical protein